MASESIFSKTDSKQIVHEIAAPIFAKHFETGELHACGTASIIGRGYAITAAHVIDDYVQKFGISSGISSTSYSNFDLLLYLSLNEGNDLLPLRVLRLWSSSMTDIAILFLGVPADFPDSHVWKIPRIQLLPPSIGDDISAFGFSNPEITYGADNIPTLDVKPYTATGRVIEVHHRSRDNARLSFPCFRVNARFDGSMSGGPVFNSSGNLCGIICSSLPADSEDSEHVSYVTTLWPMLGFLIDHEQIDNQPLFTHTLSEYFDGGHFFAIDRDEVQVNRLPGQAPTVSIKSHY